MELFNKNTRAVDGSLPQIIVEEIGKTIHIHIQYILLWICHLL